MKLPLICHWLIVPTAVKDGIFWVVVEPCVIHRTDCIWAINAQRIGTNSDNWSISLVCLKKRSVFSTGSACSEDPER